MENNLAKYIAFIKTAETGSFTRAVENLNYAQSTVSKIIADLEKEGGVTLLERSRSGVRLTSCGERVLPLARAVLNDQRELNGYIDQINGIKAGVVKIGTFASVAVNRLPNIFARLCKDYPDIEYEVLLGDYDEIERWIDEGRVDCGFLRTPADPSFDTYFLKKDEYKVVLPPKHSLAKNSSVKLSSLNGQPFLLLERGGKTEVSGLLEKNNIHPDIRFTTWKDFAVMAMAEKGLGIGILPSLILKRIPYNVEIRPLETPYYREICLAVKNKNRLTPAVKMFIEYLRFREE